MKSYQLRFDRKLFALLIIVVNAANTYLVPSISNLYYSGFLAAVLNGVIIYLSLVVQDLPETSKPRPTP